MDELLTDFIAETRETLEAIAGEIVAWEADPSDRARLDSIFRFVHTVKGSCGFLDLPRLQRLSHAAEDALAEVRSGGRVADAALVSAVLAVIDRIGELTDALEAGEVLPDAEENLIAALAPGTVTVAPASAPVHADGTPQPPRAVARSIRLPVELLDRMMAGVSDMVLARNELARRLRDGEPGQGTELAFERLSSCIGEMRDAITRTRMARIDGLFAMLPRLVRDLAAELGRLVALEVDGGDVELDREMIEMIRDPLTHIVRNALDHGIEPPAERLRAGKAEAGRLRIGARQSGNQILIEVVDDGRGIDPERVVARAIANGLITAEQAAALPHERKLALIFEPGLSTAARVTGISGRGVGMDVVRANVERLGGKVDVESRPGAGVKLSLRVPLTLTIIPALTISSAGTYFAIPRSAIDEIVRSTNPSVSIERIGGGLIACIRGTRLPIVDLARFMGLEGANAGAAPAHLVILRTGGGEHYALGVEQVHDHEELVVKPAAPALMASGIYAGTTLPDNSRPMLLLDVAGIAATAGVHALSAEPAEASAVEIAPVAASLPTLLFRDLDGVTRGVRLPLVDRIEEVPPSAAIESGGGMLLAQDGRMTALHACGTLPAAGKLRVLRLSDGQVQLAYAIHEVIDVVALPVDFAPALVSGSIAGILLHDGLPVELLDAFWLFAHARAVTTDAASPPLCLMADAEDAWAREVLAPLLRAAGYRTHFGAAPDAERVAVVVTAGAAPPGVDAPVVELRGTPDKRAPGDTSIYRYDREALLAALSHHAETHHAEAASCR